MTALVRAGKGRYGVHRAGSYSGKQAAPAGGPHPVGVLTRGGKGRYGIHRAGSFAGKEAAASGGGAHPVGILTRAGKSRYGVHRAGSYGGKTSTTPETPVVGPNPGGSGWFSRKRWRELEELLAAKKAAIAAAAEATGSRKDALEKAAYAANEAIDVFSDASIALENARIDELVRSINAAIGASRLTAALKNADKSARLAKAMIQRVFDDEEEEAIAFLLLN